MCKNKIILLDIVGWIDVWRVQNEKNKGDSLEIRTVEVRRFTNPLYPFLGSCLGCQTFPSRPYFDL